MKRLFVLVGLFLAFFVTRVLAEGPDDHYVRVYTLMQQADALNSGGQSSQALDRYNEAQKELRTLQKVYPDWNTKVVNFRLNYLADKIALTSSKVPAAKTTGAAATAVPAKQPTTVSEAERQLEALRADVQRLEGEKTTLESKLKEAFATQPATVDPRELTKSQEKVQELMKENELLKANLDQAKGGTTPNVSAKDIDAMKQALDDANRKLIEQTEQMSKLALEKEALQKQQKTEVSNAEALEALRQENALLKKQVADLKAAQPAAGAAEEQARKLAAAQASIASLQSDLDLLRQEKKALEDRLNQTPANQDARVKELEGERDNLKKELAEAKNEAKNDSGGWFGRKSKAKSKELQKEVDGLKAQLGVYEAKAVPLTQEELAMMKKPTVSPAMAQAPEKSPASGLPPGTMGIAAEAQRLFAAKQYDKAEAKYLEILRQDENNAYTLANLAAIQLEAGNLTEAEKNINHALQVSPDDGYSLSILGYLKFRQAKYDEALDALSRAAKSNPDNAEIQNYLGVTLSHKGLRVAAETALRRAVQLDPRYGSAHNNLAVIYATAQPPSMELARWHYQKALANGHPRNDELEKLFAQKPGAQAAQ